jgi:biopolymer transport protein ExbD
MKLNTPYTSSPQINLVPILDSIFILMFVFMFGLLQRMERKNLEIDLPTTQSTMLPGQNPKIRIKIDLKGDIYLENAKVSKLDLKKELSLIAFESKNSKVAISGDKNVNLGAIVEILDLVKSSGFKNVTLETKSF